MNRELIIDRSLFKNNIKNRRYSLCNFSINSKEEESDKYRKKIIRKNGIFGKVFGSHYKGIEILTEETPLINNDSPQIYMTGYWQSEKHFMNNKNIIQKDFIPINQNKLLKFVKKERLDSQESVAVHVRRGDYISDKDSSQVLGFLGESYYEEAFRMIENKIKNPTYYVFSDDIKWCKENFQNRNIVFMDKYKLKDYQEMIVMSKMGASIIANSTFSWWGAWLGEKNKQQIIAPKNWFRSKNHFCKNIIPKRWEKI